MSDDTEQTEQLRGIVGTVLPPDLRDSFVEYAKLDAFRGEDGQLDTEKVMGHLTAIHVATQRQPQQSQPNYGQHSGQPAGQHPGANARAELKRRHGVGKDEPNAPAPGTQISRGQNARAALAQRHGVRK